jgi:hypothetical protein
LPSKCLNVLAFALQQSKYSKGRMQDKVGKASAFGVVVRRLLVLALVCACLAYPASRFGVFEWPRAYDPLALPDLREKPGFMAGWQMKAVDLVPEKCAITLNRAGMTAVLKPAKNAGSACAVEGAISVVRFSAARIKAEDMRCAMAARLYAWEYQVLQPAARRLLGEEIAEITHFGSFSCRTIAGRRTMSEHATANAFDISGFRTKSGKLISVKRDWRGTGAQASFLHAARDGLCEWFNATLSPDYNTDHADHFHVDMGWWQTCR